MRVISSRVLFGAAALLVSAGILAAGSVLRPALAASASATIHPDALVTCSSGGACEVYDNRSTGEAFVGETGKGTGLYGDATKAGIGVEGSSLTGIGVFGTSSSFYGVLGTSNNVGDGVFAVGGSGVVAESISSTGDAIEGFGAGGDILELMSAADTSVFFVGDSGDAAASGEVIGGNNEAASAGGDFDGEDEGVIGSNEASRDNGTGAGDAVYANGFGGDLFVGNNSEATNAFVVDNAGNLTITGQIFTGGICSSGCVKRASDAGVHVMSYTPRESEPTMEDFGEGQLINGSGYVHLENKFARTIDQIANYYVFITPKGDNRGLYVTQETASGFAVRESQGGRSSLAFDYRIVARPFGESAARLPMVNMAADTRVKSASLHRYVARYVSRPVVPKINLSPIQS